MGRKALFYAVLREFQLLPDQCFQLCLTLNTDPFFHCFSVLKAVEKRIGVQSKAELEALIK